MSKALLESLDRTKYLYESKDREFIGEEGTDSCSYNVTVSQGGYLNGKIQIGSNYYSYVHESSAEEEIKRANKIISMFTKYKNAVKEANEISKKNKPTSTCGCYN